MIIPLKFFDRYMMCCNAEDLRKTANWTGKGVDSRSLLIERLQCKYKGVDSRSLLIERLQCK